MKPIKLVISAFGPYKDRVEIDFDKLGDNGIFLITGDTGSGKTTIFDALSFGLFGEASGSRRENGSFRSDFASDEVNTFVELSFEHKGVIYNIERVPRYTRKKKRGDGVTLVGGDASLNYLDTVVTGDKNVTDKCIEILGMNANQFKQIVMIAQGEFLNLLLSKTKDRATIFRHIFDTGIYKDISDKLKDNYLKKRREYEDSCISIKGYISSIQIEDELLEDKGIDYVLDILDKEIAKDKVYELELEEEKNNLVNISSKLIEIISEGKILNDSINSYNKAKEYLSILLNNEDAIKNNEDVLRKNKGIWDIIMPKYMELSKLKDEVLNKRNKLDNKKQEYDDILKDYEVILDKYNGIKIKLEEIQVCNRLIEDNSKKIILLDDISKYRDELDSINKKLLYCNLMEKSGILDKFRDAKNKEISLNELRAKIIKLRNEYVKDNELYVKNYDMFLSAQAGILASNLKDGDACPVCGSFNHPNLAKIVANVLTKEELDKEKTRLEDKYKELENYRLELVAKEKELDSLKNELKEKNENVLIAEIDNLKGKCIGLNFDISKIDINKLDMDAKRLELLITEKYRDLDDNIDKDSLICDINNKKKLVNSIEKEIEDIRNSYDKVLKDKSSIESLIKVLGDDIDSLNNSIDKLQVEYVNVYQKLGYDNEEEYLKVKIEKNELKNIEEEVSKYREELTSVKNNISNLEKIVKDKVEVKLEAYNEELNEVNKKLDVIGLSLKNINNKLFNNKKIYDNLKDVSQKTTKLEKEVMIYKDLSDTANGTIAGKSKLEFEQYVQASYFDRVLVSANKRLSYMTDDRYELLRKEEATKVSDKLGLELEVMDYYTGKKRDIKSLSGGESFKASLSLALGMSDTIQEFSGGVVVEAMFIDEGFGSLDDESLEQAMNAMMMLSQGNKIIGIISHVNELKSRIDKKIVVKKSSMGSSVSLVV